MSDLQSVTSIFRSPEAAALAAQGLQAAETAARQGAERLREDALHRQHQVQAGEAVDKPEPAGPRMTLLDQEARRRRQAPNAGPKAAGNEAPQPQHRLDITA